MNRFCLKNVLWITLALCLIGCSAAQKITYSTERLAAKSSTALIPAMVDVRILEDRRRDFDENKVLFQDANQLSLNGVSMCVNSEFRYLEKDTVAHQITKVMVDHFNQARLFGLSSYNRSEHSDHYLTGTLNSFYFQQKYSPTPVMGVLMFGLLGALSVSQGETPGKIVIDISDIKLYRNDGTLVKDFGHFRKEAFGEFSFTGDCKSAYRNANKMLRDYNTLLIEKIRSEMEGVELN